jgi:hypothetical protein
MMNFGELGIGEELRRILSKNGITEPTALRKAEM